jgi:hypothetical protein
LGFSFIVRARAFAGLKHLLNKLGLGWARAFQNWKGKKGKSLSYVNYLVKARGRTASSDISPTQPWTTEKKWQWHVFAEAVFLQKNRFQAANQGWTLLA